MNITVSRGNRRKCFTIVAARTAGLPAERQQSLRIERERAAEDLKSYLFRPALLS